MGKSRLPTLQEIDELTAFVPRLYHAGFSPVVRWDGGQRQPDGSFTLPYPRYDNLVEDFFRLAARDCWLDHGYNPMQAWQMLIDETLIRRASLAEIRTTLTFCLRGEHFSDGHWVEMIEKGYIRQLLERLVVIKREQFGE